jgi:trehalose-6-phosphate synthase
MTTPTNNRATVMEIICVIQNGKIVEYCNTHHEAQRKAGEINRKQDELKNSGVAYVEKLDDAVSYVNKGGVL